MTELLSTPANDFTPSDTKRKEVVHFLRVIVICSEAFSFWSPSQHLSLYSSSFLNPYTVVQVFSYLSDGPRWWLPFLFFFYFLYKLVSERPFSYLSDSWFPPQRPPQSYVRLQRVFGKLETVNLFWCSHVGKPDIWAPFQHLPGELWKWTQFPVPPVWRNCAVCVSVLLAWLARCSVLTVGSVVAGVSAFSCASAKKLSASFPSRLCGLSGSWFACDCLRYFLNAYSSCVCVWF